VKMQSVSDATPLIHLAKIGKLDYLSKLFTKIHIPKEIHTEVVLKGKELGKSEVFQIEDLINKRFILVHDISSELNLPHLHAGEADAIALCQELKIRSILVDDKEGYDTALMMGLKPLRTTALLLMLRNRKHISFSEFRHSLLKLSKSGFFLSAEVFEKLLGNERFFGIWNESEKGSEQLKKKVKKERKGFDREFTSP